MIPNIGPGERRKRLVFAAVQLGIALVLAVGLVVGGAPRAWRVTAFMPLWLAGLGYFQARDKT